SSSSPGVPPATGGGTGSGSGTGGGTSGGTGSSSGSGGSGRSGGGTGGSGSPPPAIVNLTTYHNSLGRTGANTSESILTPANVNVQQFGKLFALPLEGETYAQPLYLANVNVPGKGVHNVVYVATQHDIVYAFDADGKSSTPLWQDTFINPAAGITPVASNDIFDGYEDL